MPEQGVRVLLVDDHPLFVEAVKALLAGEPRVVVVGVARNGREAVELVPRLRPDVVLLDISMPVMDGIEAARQIAEAGSDARILVLTGSSAHADVARARAA